MRARAQIQAQPVHPILVRFPFGLWIAGFALELAGFGFNDPALWAAAWYAILAGCVGAALAAIFGAIDLFSVVPPRSSARFRGYTHAFLNVCALGLYIATLALLGSPAAEPYWLPLLLSGLGVPTVFYAGWLGGTLVFRNQIGVDHRHAGAGEWRERTLENWDHPVCGEHELAYGQMMLVHVAGRRVVVGRCTEGFVAFADRCTHRGGPLSDGVLIGCTVQCPWHGSQFDLRSGHVAAGPATVQIPIYSVQIRGGEVYVTPAPDLPQAAA